MYSLQNLLVLCKFVRRYAFFVVSLNVVWIRHRLQYNLLDHFGKFALFFFLCSFLDLSDAFSCTNFVQSFGLFLNEADLISEDIRLHVWIVCISIYIFNDLLKVSTVNVDFVRVIWACSSKLLTVRVEVIIHKCHLSAVRIFLELLNLTGINLAPHLIKYVVALLGEA